MKKCLLLLSLILPRLVQGQSMGNIVVQNVSFSATNVVPLNFTYNNINQLLHYKSLDASSPTGAIRLDLCTNTLGWNIFAKVLYTGGPSSTPDNWIKHIWVSDNSPSDQNLALQTNLNGANQLLFTQPTAGVYSFYYNLKLNPTTSFVTPGLYNYTIQYTMTRP